MNHQNLRFWGLAVLAGALLTFAPAAEAKPHQKAQAVTSAEASQPKPTLRLKATSDQTARYKTVVQIGGEVAGQKLNIEVEQVTAVKFISVTPDGKVTMERTQESSISKMEGEVIDDEPDKDVTTEVYSQFGVLLSQSGTGDKKQREIGVRVSAATTILFPEGPVGPGDKWTQNLVANSDLGTRGAKADFEVLGLEKIEGIETAKIKMTYTESAGEKPIQAESTAWIEIASGDTIKSEFKINNIQFGDGPASFYASATGTTTRISGGPVKGQATAGSDKPEPKKEKQIEDVVKDFEKLPGVFTLYRKTDNGRTTIYMEIGEKQLGKLAMLQATASTGTSSQVVAGNPINDIVFRFVEVEKDRIVMVVPNFGFRANPDTPIGRSVKRSFTESHIESFRVEARNNERKSLLINVSDLFRGDIAQVSSVFSGSGIPGLGGGGGYSLDREKTFIKKLKAFPENVVVETMYAFSGGRGGRSLEEILLGGASVIPDSRSLVFQVNYNLWLLPENNYVPRHFDARVGYFTTDFQSFDKPTAEDQTVHYILRWNLQKKDPSAAMSEPVKPITFWLDNAIPTEYRPAVSEAILGWNKAYEKIGFKNAIVVKQMPDNADFDHADMRYNVIRWVTSPSDAYAIALFRVNPLTGEIVNAGINVDNNIVRLFAVEKAKIVDPASYFEPKSHNEAGHDHRLCQLGEDAMRQARFGALALKLMMPGMSQLTEHEYVSQFIRWVVGHEFGHILGLRHNFIASTQLSLAELKDPAKVAKYGTAASMMDYMPFNVSALGIKGIPYWSQNIGDYDHWAIDYGYRLTGAKDPNTEISNLKKLASRSGEPGLAWQSDEVADNADPLITRFDLSANPIEYWARMMNLSKQLTQNLDQRYPKNGESYYEFTKALNQLLDEYIKGVVYTSRYIGGISIRGNFKGDPGGKLPLMPVSAADQRQALQLVNRHLFAEGALAIPAKYYGMAASNPTPSMADGLTGNTEFPIRDMISGIQSQILKRLFGGQVLSRVANNEYKLGAAAKPLTVAELMRTIGSNIWSELSSGAEISTLRRSLQRTHIELLTDMVTKPGGAPDDAKLIAASELRRLKVAIMAALKAPKGEYGAAHLTDALARVNRALSAQIQIGSAPARQPSLLEQLMGGGVKPKSNLP